MGRGRGFEVRSSKFEGGLDLADALALILRQARPAVLTRMLLQLPGRLPAEVLHRIASVNLSQVQHRIEEEAGVFFWKLREALGDVRLKPAPELAARALRPIAPHLARQILTDAHRIDPGTMKAVQDLAYPFEDLTRLPDPELQRVLMGVENRDIALALQTTPAVVQDRIEQGMSLRRKQATDEEAGLAGEVSEEASRSAQSRILDRARLLYEQGQLHAYFGSIEDAGAAGQTLQQARQAVYGKHAAWMARWIQSGRGQRQSAGVALAALALVVVGALLLKYLAAAGRAVHPKAQEERQRREGETGPKRGNGETGKRGITASPLLPFSVSGIGGQGGGLRVSLAPGGEVEGKGFQPGGDRRGIWLRAGTMRVAVLDSTALLETPLVRVTGEAGAAYRVRVGTTTRLTALRGALQALPVEGKGGVTRIAAGLEVVFSPGGTVQVLTANLDAEDLAWLEKNR